MGTNVRTASFPLISCMLPPFSSIGVLIEIPSASTSDPPTVYRKRRFVEFEPDWYLANAVTPPISIAICGVPVTLTISSRKTMNSSCWFCKYVFAVGGVTKAMDGAVESTFTFEVERVAYSKFALTATPAFENSILPPLSSIESAISIPFKSSSPGWTV